MKNLSNYECGYPYGIYDGTALRFGIDAEGYGGSIDYEKPLKINIRNNKFVGNVGARFPNFSGYETT